ncbi:hypothetical protein ACXYMX_09935 [Sporosarcina sp. CAU 1771]
MRKHVYIAPKTISTEEKQIGFPEDSSFWNSLWSMFSKKAATMEIHCWVVEKEIREQLDDKMIKTGTIEETIVYHSELTDDLVDWVLADSYDIRGGLKWFSIFLFDVSGVNILTVGHYGGEIVFYPENDEEIEKVKSFFEEDTAFTVYE